MNSLPHFAEIGLLVLGAYLIGCIVGAVARRLASGRTAVEAVQSPPVKSPQSPARGLPSIANLPVVAVHLPEPEAPRVPKTTPAQRLAATIEAAAREKAAVAAAKAAAVAEAEAEAAKVAVEAAAIMALATQPAASVDEPLAETGGLSELPKYKVRSGFGKPEAIPAPRDGRPDNLKQIKGIGPRIERGLNDLGVFHFDQIAAWDRKTIVWVETHFSFKGRIDREKWILQARELTKGATRSFRTVKA